jgi:hypothetical protein
VQKTSACLYLYMKNWCYARLFCSLILGFLEYRCKVNCIAKQLSEILAGLIFTLILHTEQDTDIVINADWFENGPFQVHNKNFEF